MPPRKIKGVNIYIVDDQQNERVATRKEVASIRVWEYGGHYQNNVIKIKNSIPRTLMLHIQVASNNNTISIGSGVRGAWHFDLLEGNNSIEIGESTTSTNIVDIHLCGHKLIIGKDCMFASQICIWGDSHSVLDLTTKTVHNKPDTPILIGNHVWVCERVCMTKNAQIPDDTIVAMASLVTKKFTQEHTIIAGVPAKVVKTGITWDRFSPLTYEDRIKSTKK